MRKTLGDATAQATFPPGIQLAPFESLPPHAVHAVLAEVFASDSFAPFDDWYAWLTTDAEYDPNLVFVALTDAGAPVAVAQCWTSGFIKDLAVLPEWRGKGLGEALLNSAFAAFQARGFSHIDLKVVADNAPALRLYRRVGMVEVSL